MLTPTHGCLANIFSWIFKSKWKTKEHFFFYLGAVFPDIPIVTAGLIEWIKYIKKLPELPGLWQLQESFFALLLRGEHPPAAGALFSSVEHYATAIWLGQFFHSIFFWVLILLFARYFFKSKSLEIFCWGAIWLHLFVDWLTHTTHAHKYFWPFVDSPIPGFISHENPWLFRAELGIAFFWFMALLYVLLCRLNPKKY